MTLPRGLLDCRWEGRCPGLPKPVSERLQSQWERRGRGRVCAALLSFFPRFPGIDKAIRLAYSYEKRMPTYRILVAEDNPEWSELLQILLESPRYQVMRADSGRQALALAFKTPPDAAVLDIRLPDMSGQDLCRRLREIAGLECLPIVALSSFSAEKIRSLELGVDAFVSKVTGQTELVPTLEALLRRVQMDSGVLVKGDLRLEPRGNAVMLGDKTVATLSRTEFLLLYVLVKRSPAPVSKAELRRSVLHHDGEDHESRALEMLMTRTRRRLGKPLSERIRGSRSFGWLYLAQAESESVAPARPLPS